MLLKKSLRFFDFFPCLILLLFILVYGHFSYGKIGLEIAKGNFFNAKGNFFNAKNIPKGNFFNVTSLDISA